MAKITFPYITAQMLISGENDIISAITTKFPQYSWLSKVPANEINLWILSEIANEINNATGATQLPPTISSGKA